ncbi:cutinase family protein [Raineyella fluvialis]|uniref:Cutinase family protein n=1 Tax=Raineyella fluvialis TaxID=2662261 RepID=A0A5Q2FFC6_9ACTN|nr:cutinase family protein [Raineyella fluvialis]QGF24214.1 cutinase family protein [Raineyella fluvialis]
MRFPRLTGLPFLASMFRADRSIAPELRASVARRRRRRVAAGVGASLALYSAVVAMPADAATRPAPAPAMTTVIPCQDVMFIGVRGSGETPDASLYGMGPESALAWQQYRMEIPGHSAAAMSIDYPSTSVTTLASPYSSDEFFRSIDTGVMKLEAVMAERSVNCPNEHYVISGKSQGSIITHRAMADMAAHRSAYGTGLMDRIDGVLAIADPDRLPDDSGHLYGSTATGADHYGISYAAPFIAGNRYRPTTANVDTFWAHPDRWHTICNAGDSVCDFTVSSSSPSNMLRGFDIHMNSYVTDPTGVRTAAADVAAQTRSRTTAPEQAPQAPLV